MNDTALETEEKLSKLQYLAECIEDHTVGIKITVEYSGSGFPFLITTETDIPVMVDGSNAGKPTWSEGTYHEAKYFLQGLMHGLVFAGGWQE